MPNKFCVYFGNLSKIQHILPITQISAMFLYYFTASFKAFPDTNLGTFLALIFISAPVCGFTPFLAFLCATLKVPKPIRVTVSFFFNALVMVDKTQSTAGLLESGFSAIVNVNRSRVYPPLEGSPAVILESWPADQHMAASFTFGRIQGLRMTLIHKLL